MAIRVALPTDIPNIILNIEGLNDLKAYLIKGFENPRVKKTYGQSTFQEATVGAFSMGKFLKDYTTQVNSNNMSKLISKMDSLQTYFQTIQNRGTYKPKTLPIEAGIMLNPIITLLISVDLMVEKNSLYRTI